MSRYLLAVDGGSQSTKVSVVDEHGVVHASARAPLAAYLLGAQGEAVHPDDDLWDTLVLAVRRVVADFAGEPDQIVALGLCGIRSCRAMVDVHGRLTEPVLSWMDDRVARPLEALGPGVDLVTSAGGYLAVRLTGERRDSAASYAGTWPIDVRAGGWAADEAAYAETGMAPHLLPELVAPGGLLGRLTGPAAQATGLRAGTPVHATGNDKAVEALGCGVLEPDTVLLSLGTYVAAMRPGGWRDDPGPSYWVNAAAVPGAYLHESAGIRRGMWTVSWVRRLVTAGAAGAAAAGPGVTVDDAAVSSWLEAGAAEVPPGSEGLLTLPDWLPPQDSLHRRGTVVGYDARHEPAHLYRSVLEGIALTMQAHVEAMESAQGSPAPRLLVSGGGSRSAVMMQVVAGVFDRRTARPAQPDAAGLGAAICAAVGAGVHPGFPEAVAAMVPPATDFDPDPVAVAAYAEVREAHDRVRTDTDAMYRRLGRGVANPPRRP